jgi:hypothetical protein
LISFDIVAWNQVSKDSPTVASGNFGATQRRYEAFAIFTPEKKVIFGAVLGCSDLQCPYIPPRVHKGVDVALATIQSFRRRLVLTPGGFKTGRTLTDKT